MSRGNYLLKQLANDNKQNSTGSKKHPQHGKQPKSATKVLPTTVPTPTLQQKSSTEHANTSANSLQNGKMETETMPDTDQTIKQNAIGKASKPQPLFQTPKKGRKTDKSNLDDQNCRQHFTKQTIDSAARPVTQMIITDDTDILCTYL